MDTTFLTDAERVGGQLDDVIDDNDDVAMATITVAELRVGVELCRGKTRIRRQKFLDDVLANVPVIDYDLRSPTLTRNSLSLSGNRAGPGVLMIS